MRHICRESYSNLKYSYSVQFVNSCNYKYNGTRCEIYKCTDYCFNKGVCNVKPSSGEPKCL